jgi:hypothetical protein
VKVEVTRTETDVIRMSEAKIDPLSPRARLAPLLAAPDPSQAGDAIKRLFDAQNDLQWELFGEPDDDDRPTPISTDDPRLAFVLDALATLAVREPDDSAHPWHRACVLSRVGRHSEAATDYLEAARRFEHEFENGDGVTGDEAEWAAAAHYHAAESFVRAAQPLAAQSLLDRLSEDDRARIAPLIERLLIRAAS